MRMRNLLVVTALAAGFLASPALAASKNGMLGAASGKGVSRAQQSCGKLERTNISGSVVNFSTASVVLVPLPGSDVNFNTSRTGCVSVDFQAQAFSPGTGNLLLAQATLDGVPSVDGEIQIQSDSFVFSNTHGYTFSFVNVPAGNHDVQIQVRSGTGSLVSVNKHTLRTDHR
jgi:hypothetical protein